jgi:UDP-N-acetylmuramate--alanine ligase
MKNSSQNTAPLHFIGIGGIGMSGIAEIMHTLGYAVQGSDQADGYNIQRLKKNGIRVIVGHAAANIQGKNNEQPAAVVISSAVKPDNVELLAARAAKIPVMRRAEMLAELMRLKKSIAISGTHGKTTTTAMIGHMMDVAGFDPTVINGGIVNAYGTNVRLGKSEWMVVEADESDGTFTRLPAEIAVVTNMDPEHMDHYGSFENVRAAYRQFIMNLPFYGFGVLCVDHPEVQALVSAAADRRIVTYGFNPQADVQAHNVKTGAGGSVFDVRFSEVLTGGAEEFLRDIHLPMAGAHNVQNSLAAIAIARRMDVPAATVKKAIGSLTGVKRRFTKTGESNGVTIIDDYGHHPVEISTVLKTARSVVAETKGRVIAVAQPHRFTRLRDLFEDFCTCFNEADVVIIADVYTAGEAPIAGFDKVALVEGIKKHGHKAVSALPSKDDLPRMVSDIAQPGDYVVCLGAGDITAWAYALPAQMDEIFGKSKKQSA